MTNKPGRPKLKRPTKDKKIRIFVDQKEKLDKLGGSKWVRDKIDEVKDESELSNEY